MPGEPFLFETMYGASAGYADVQGDEGTPHSHFVVWLVVFALIATAILGGLKVGGFHFVVRA